MENKEEIKKIDTYKCDSVTCPLNKKNGFCDADCWASRMRKWKIKKKYMKKHNIVNVGDLITYNAESAFECIYKIINIKNGIILKLKGGYNTTKKKCKYYYKTISLLITNINILSKEGIKYYIDRKLDNFYREDDKNEK